MNIILMGPPGAGKGTQAEHIATALNIPHISTGDAFRLAIGEGTELGRKAKEYVDQGKLVPDELTVGIVRERLERSDCHNGFLLDGFPRTISQAEALDEIVRSFGKGIDHVIDIAVERGLLLARLTGRRVCQSCGATYHEIFNPPKEAGNCDKCEGELYQRSDDSEQKVGTRLDEYTNKTAPLLKYYDDRGLLRPVDGEQSIDQVKSSIQTLLRSQNV